jgi:hypothetical protein
MTTNELRTVYQTILEVIEEKVPNRRTPYIHPADDTNKGNGHTYKIHTTAGYNHIWTEVLARLKEKGITWYHSVNRYKDVNIKKVVESKWVGIRSIKHPRSSK